MSVLVVFEHRAGKWNRMSFEGLTAGFGLSRLLGFRRRERAHLSQ